ncbi:MAG TPA: HD domain-containing phosphohydrolase [Candidatus Dormibacteraeota bacterium]|nr:HD domain-containing phosphohydrolase [Candidatus Dormibacteraeota bacterium]
MRLSIRDKIILPFVVLLVFVGVIGTAIATTQVTGAAATNFDAKLLHSSLVDNQLLAQLDATRAGDLRLATDTLGVPEALAANDRTTLIRLLTPVAANITADTAVVCVLDATGKVVLRIERTSSHTVVATVTDPTGFEQVTDVRKVLSSTVDIPDRRAFLDRGSGPATLYWAGPIWLGGRMVGAAMIGESVAEIAGSIQHSTFYDLGRNPVASLFSNPPTLADTTRQSLTSANAVQGNVTHDGHAYRALFSTWMMRGNQIGYLAVEENEDPLLGEIAQLRLILTLVFTVAALLTLIVGSATASLLTRPVQRLVQSMRAVSGGDLHHRATVSSHDEIGYLARTFNEMAASLEEKTASLEQTTFASMEALARAIDARDSSTFGHSARVAAISAEIADELHLPDKDREALRRAALLHDIGKIGIEDKVLRKPGPLNAAEADDMREHPRIGYDMLKGLPFLRSSLPGILYHHERWDGTGYPTGLSGSAIPYLVRILAVADVFDALTSERPYRSGLSVDAASAAIRNEVGLQFDPDVVTAFLARRPAIAAIVEKTERPNVVKVQPEAA